MLQIVVGVIYGGIALKITNQKYLTDIIIIITIIIIIIILIIIVVVVVVVVVVIIILSIIKRWPPESAFSTDSLTVFVQLPKFSSTSVVFFCCFFLLFFFFFFFSFLIQKILGAISLFGHTESTAHTDSNSERCSLCGCCCILNRVRRESLKSFLRRDSGRV